jgi:hypothetical protein
VGPNLDRTNPDDACQSVTWEELSANSQEYYIREGLWTQETWNKDLFIRVDEDVENLLWKDICDAYRRKLEARGWTEEAWNGGDISRMKFYNEAELNFDQLPEDRKNHWVNFQGFSRSDFEMLFDSGQHRHLDLIAPGSDFQNFPPVVLPLAVPELQSLNFSHLEERLGELKVGLRSSSTKGENEDFIGSATLSDYVARIRAGEKHTYCK